MVNALLLTTLLTAQADSPKQALLDLRDRYSKLDGIRIDIEQELSSGLFPGKYRQELLFSKKNGFRLVVKVPKGEKRPEGSSYDYYYSGNQVTTMQNGEPFTAELNTDPNVMPGYEVSGFLILSWMLNSPACNHFIEPPKGYKLDYSWGSRSEWHGQKVKELDVNIKQEGSESGPQVVMFVSTDKKMLLGYEWKIQGKIGYLLYSNEKDNPETKPSDFEPPKSG